MIRSTAVPLLSLVAIALELCAPASATQRAVLRRSASAGGARVFVASATSFLPAVEVTKRLRKKDGFARLGLEIADEPNDADYIVEVDRAVLTRFTFVVLDAKTHALVARGDVSSLFGTASGRIADRVVRILADRAAAP